MPINNNNNTKQTTMETLKKLIQEQRELLWWSLEINQEQSFCIDKDKFLEAKESLETQVHLSNQITALNGLIEKAYKHLKP